MWKPENPIVIAGSALSDQEAWWHEFTDEFHELCGGKVDGEWLTGLVAMLYPLNIDREPREAAEVAFMTLGYELPDYESEEPFTPPAPRRRPGLH
ncbi:hypothetical protein [Variovorax paradoxus]|jgi:hypothetical protein|uniref:hypothetical protein n=1 Tax=Variovorax paradoxus TaxID=34073 RepID=UPI0029C6E3AF|nr:hypothetical protein [Variovorax paradoxus]WPH22338.1 hypothetical protein RZE78_09275 [Variovorax paradoxus]